MTPRWDPEPGSRPTLIPPDIAKLLGYSPPTPTPDTTGVPTSLGASDPLRRGATRRRRYVGLFDESRLTPEQRAELAAEAPPIVPEVEQQQQQQQPAEPATKRDAVVLRLFGRDASPATTDNPTTEQES
jgi:hypothetical protein